MYFVSVIFYSDSNDFILFFFNSECDSGCQGQESGRLMNFHELLLDSKVS